MGVEGRVNENEGKAHRKNVCDRYRRTPSLDLYPATIQSDRKLKLGGE